MVARRKQAQQTRNGAGASGPHKSVYYPESDGKPMGETETHVRELLRLLQTLDLAYADRPDVYVGADLFVYCEEGNPRASVAPDVLVALGASKLPLRRTYKIWEEGVPPSFVIEITSPSTRRDDLVRKREIYAGIGVQEYVLYDPLAEYLRPALQGLRLQAGEYVPMRTSNEALISDVLNLELVLADSQLQLVDRRSGALLQSASQQLAVEQEARNRLEVRLAELEAELQRRPPSL